MAEQCCLYIVTYAPPGCSGFSVDDWVTGPCEPGCPDVQVEGGPCDGLYLSSTGPDCIECGSAAALRTDAADLKARAAKRDPSVKRRKISSKDLGAFRRIEAAAP